MKQEYMETQGWCLGCGRTREESNKWKSMTQDILKTIEKTFESVDIDKLSIYLLSAFLGSSYL